MTNAEYGRAATFALTCSNSQQSITVNFPPATDTWNDQDALIVSGVFKFDGSNSPLAENFSTKAHRVTS